ncbi:hypothetical protein [Blastococcus saxobsidens]|uniref:Uncharacterized protein n=1 Tax=Blastococcus saxobsidens (strain DD2) TaxID=1146883 RepID=H6RS32_BLASD|nr:hypothetical protein [Blastococcus saxobsidens]CCG04226.1 exported protein of unknown function [Blastococcus saxobsidens DD2]
MSSALGHGRRRAARWVSVAGLAAGLLLLARPAAVAAVVDPGFPRDWLWLARVLAGRSVAGVRRR